MMTYRTRKKQVLYKDWSHDRNANKAPIYRIQNNQNESRKTSTLTQVSPTYLWIAGQAGVVPVIF